MFTVSILINGQPLYTRSCFREKTGIYKVDDGSIIEHEYNDGAIVLAHKLLDTIKELQREDKIKELADIIEKHNLVGIFINEQKEKL